MKLLPSRHVPCTPYNYAPCHFIQNHIRKVHACLAVTCRLHFRLNDRDLLRATAVTRGWIGYRNKSLHRKLTLEKKFLPPLQQGFEPATFQSWVRRSNHWAIPAPIGTFVYTYMLEQPQHSLLVNNSTVVRHQGLLHIGNVWWKIMCFETSEETVHVVWQCLISHLLQTG